MAAIRFRDGRIGGATSPAAPDLGELLVRARKLTPVALRAVRTAQPEGTPDDLLAERLVEEGLADEGTVRDALRRKVEAAIREVLRWSGGDFAFNREGDGAPDAASPLELDAQDVLLNVLRQMDEEGRGQAPAAPR
jgi:hypothetical protein